MALLVPGLSLFAHHSPSAIFDMKKVVTMTGTLSKVEWVNPHIQMYMDVKGADGAMASWKLESQPPRWFTKVGVNRADFAANVGKTVTVDLVVALDGSKYGYLHKITFADGTTFSVTESETKDKINP
jgi:hypothetical protein